MRYWDTSAVVSLLLSEQASAPAWESLEADSEMAVWWGTRVECLSAIHRRERERSIGSDQVAGALATLEELAEGWTEIRPTDAVRAEADRAVAVHELTAADAFQLAAAIAWRGPPDNRRGFVCLDRQLAERARREGFDCPLQA